MHYLTKWAFALNRMALVMHEPHYNELAIQLIKGGSHFPPAVGKVVHAWQQSYSERSQRWIGRFH